MRIARTSGLVDVTRRSVSPATPFCRDRRARLAPIGEKVVEAHEDSRGVPRAALGAEEMLQPEEQRSRRRKSVP
jgi:hypothetical protein